MLSRLTHRRRRFVGALWPAPLAFALLAAAPPLVAAQDAVGYMDAPAKLVLTTTSDAAKERFWTGVAEMDNSFFNKAATAFESALAADSTFGLARAYWGFSAPGLTQDQRLIQVRRGLAAMAGSTPAEILLALGIREQIAGNSEMAYRVYATAAEAAPGDPHVVYSAAASAAFGGDTANAIARLKTVTSLFPTYAPTWNVLSYQLWSRGQHADGLAAVKQYVDLMPNHPNAHDSYAELLQWDGELAEAAGHYRKALSLDPNYTAGYTGLAEVDILGGKNEDARKALGDFRAHTPTPQGKINADRAIAGTYLMEGNLKAAMAGYGNVARAAEAGGFKGLARTAHRQAAVADAMFGKGMEAKAHLARAAELVETDSVGQMASGVIVAAYTGDMAGARALLDRLDRATAANAGWNDARHQFRAMILLREKKVDEALAHLAKADQTDGWTMVLTAQAFDKQNKTAEAAELRQKVLSDGQLNLFNNGTPAVRRMAMNIT